MSSSLQQLLDQRQLWRGRDAGDSVTALPTGWQRLDRELYGAGWPQGCLTELLCSEPVLAWQLLQPALVRLSRQQRLLLWIGHEQPPYAPAWYKAGLQLTRCLLVRANEDQAPWAAEQALRLAQGGAVILQSNVLTPDRLRRLQLAAQAGNSHAFLLRPLSAQRQTTPASLRLQLAPAVAALQLQILKRRGGTASDPFSVPMPVAAAVLPAPTVVALSRTEAMTGALPASRLERGLEKRAEERPRQKSIPESMRESMREPTKESIRASIGESIKQSGQQTNPITELVSARIAEPASAAVSERESLAVPASAVLSASVTAPVSVAVSASITAPASSAALLQPSQRELALVSGRS
ncbi:MAG: translesion DNA synthesis-associated protein ImuA [Pseudomonadota bacterium]